MKSNTEHKDIDGYKYADFKTYNSYASENGLGDTCVYVIGKVIKTVDIGNLTSIMIQSDDGGNWLASVGDSELFSKKEFSAYVGKSIKCFGKYTGFSDITKTPAMFITKIDMDNKMYYYNSDELTSKSFLDYISVEDFKPKCKEYEYKKIARNPNDYVQKPIKIKGEVIQVMEDGLDVNLRVNMTFNPYSSDSKDGYYSDTVLIYYTKKDEDESRILENDIITVYGVFNGTVSYKSVLGAEVTVPSIIAVGIDIESEISIVESSVESSDTESSRIETSKAESSKTESSRQEVSVVSSSYQLILDEYSEKIKVAAPKLVDEYNKEAANYSGNIDKLAEICNKKIEKLAEISNEGIQKMAQLMYDTNDSYNNYENWANKLMDVYTDEASKITDAYIKSAM